MGELDARAEWWATLTGETAVPLSCGKDKAAELQSLVKSLQRTHMVRYTCWQNAVSWANGKNRMNRHLAELLVIPTLRRETLTHSVQSSRSQLKPALNLLWVFGD